MYTNNVAQLIPWFYHRVTPHRKSTNRRTFSMFYNTNLNAALIQDLEPDSTTLIKLYIYLGTQFDGVLSTSQAAKSFMGTGLLTLVIFSDFTFSVILKEHYVFGH